MSVEPWIEYMIERLPSAFLFLMIPESHSMYSEVPKSTSERIEHRRGLAYVELPA